MDQAGSGYGIETPVEADAVEFNYVVQMSIQMGLQFYIILICWAPIAK